MMWMPNPIGDGAAESDLDETRLDQPACQMQQCCASAAGIISTMCSHACNEYQKASHDERI
jgi:hypothetical protein